MQNFVVTDAIARRRQYPPMFLAVVRVGIPAADICFQLTFSGILRYRQIQIRDHTPVSEGVTYRRRGHRWIS